MHAVPCKSLAAWQPIGSGSWQPPINETVQADVDQHNIQFTEFEQAYRQWNPLNLSFDASQLVGRL